MKIYLQTLTETAKELANDPTVFQQVINLLEIIIWPITLLIGLLFFKDQIAKVINSVGSIKAGASGFEMSFINEKLQEATKKIGIGSDGIKAKAGGSINPKSGGSINPKSGGSINPKSGETIKPNIVEKTIPKTKYADTPYQELLELQDTIYHELKYIANNNNISITSTSNFTLTNSLLEYEVISSSEANKLKMLIELINIGLNSPQITYDQVIQMRKLYNNINLN
jgi:hypothetical protein